MDLNELLGAHQVEVMKAKASGEGEARESHFQNVAEYAERVRALRNISPADAVVDPAASRETIIYGTYAGGPTTIQNGSLNDAKGQGGNRELSGKLDWTYSND